MMAENTSQKSPGSSKGIDGPLQTESINGDGAAYSFPSTGEVFNKVQYMAYTVDFGKVKGLGYMFSPDEKFLYNVLFLTNNRSMDFDSTDLSIDELIMGNKIKDSPYRSEGVLERSGEYGGRPTQKNIINYNTKKPQNNHNKTKIKEGKHKEHGNETYDYKTDAKNEENNPASNTSNDSFNQANVNLTYNDILNHIKNIFNIEIQRGSDKRDYSSDKTSEYETEERKQDYKTSKPGIISKDIEYATGIEDILNGEWEGIRNSTETDDSRNYKEMKRNPEKATKEKSEVSKPKYRETTKPAATNQGTRYVKGIEEVLNEREESKGYKRGTEGKYSLVPQPDTYSERLKNPDKNPKRYIPTNQNNRSYNSDGRERRNIEDLIENSPIHDYGQGKRNQKNINLNNASSNYDGKSTNSGNYKKGTVKIPGKEQPYGLDETKTDTQSEEDRKREVWRYEPHKISPKTSEKKPHRTTDKQIKHSDTDNKPSSGQFPRRDQKMLRYEEPLTTDDFLYGRKKSENLSKNCIPGKIYNYAEHPANQSAGYMNRGHIPPHFSSTYQGMPKDGLSKLSSPPKDNIVDMKMVYPK